MRIKNYTISNLSQIALVNGTATANVAEDIKISGSMALDLFLKFTNTAEDRLHNLIKVALPNDPSVAMELLQTGIKYNDRKYVALATTTSFMKKETKDGEIEEKCEFFFIDEADKDFVDFFEDTISLGKLTEKKQQKSVEYLNKDIVARLSLVWSRSGKLPNYSWKNKIVILPETAYAYTDTYVKMDKQALENGEIKLTESSEETVEITAFDGFGIGSNEFFNEVSKSYKHKIDWCTIRTSLGIKGLVTRFDFHAWLDDNYQGDTEFFQKREDGYYTVDIFGQWVNVSKAHLILNETQVKWGKHWKGQTLQDVYETIETKYAEYQDILFGMYIMNVNRAVVPTHTKMNYQPLNVLNLTPNEMKQLTAYDEECYNEIFFGEDLDKKKIYLGHLARENSEDVSHTTKLSQLLMHNDDFFNTKVTRQHMKHLAQSSLDRLAGGKFHVKGHFKSLACDAVAYLGFMINRNLEVTALGKGEFYSPNDLGKRVFARNPLASFIEPVKAELIECNSIEKYLQAPYATDVVFFNQKDDTAKTLSGADMDGDQALVIDNEIIYNSVIDHVKFHNDADGEKGEAVPYTKENVYDAVIRTSGNMIGNIAIATAKLNTYCQDIPYKLVKTGKMYTKNELIAIYKNAVLLKDEKFIKIQDYIKLLKDDIEYHETHSLDNASYDVQARIVENRELLEEKTLELRQYAIKKFHEWLENQIKVGNIVDLLETATEQELKEIISQRFADHAHIIFYCLYLNMKSIDSVKTMKLVTEAENKIRKEAFKKKFDGKGWESTYNIGRKYPVFLYKLKDYVQLDSLDHYNRSSLVLNSKRIYQDLIKPIDVMAKGTDSRKFDFKYFNLANQEPVNKELEKATKEAYEIYASTAKILNSKRKILPQTEINKEWDIADRAIAELLEPYMGEEWINAKAIVLRSFEHALRFTIKYFYDVLFHFVEKREVPVAFTESEQGTIELFYKKYAKKEVNVAVNDMHQAEHYKSMARRAKKQADGEREISLIRCANKDGHVDVAKVNKFIVNGDTLLTEDGELIGAIYSKDSFGYVDGQVIEPLYKDITKSSFGLYFRG